jgi:hypothetical protein
LFEAAKAHLLPIGKQMEEKQLTTTGATDGDAPQRVMSLVVFSVKET